ncbi:putative manganese-dependent inorganic diphosphatase [Defluviitalea phaphyphila]|uniref:putative manganese-dependent inorganic diphosphatase n=1 Tax=Defluviitalea phaphyphila TaxID=1473580 RepID=UPI00072FD7C0|nr:putative manganese-dependent inorganic diphosphatase [Defluviitalea phaphyphila]
MNKTIFVFGHLNPDTDSICSAIAYANLKKELGYKNVQAARLGKINKETTYALNYFKVEPPKLLDNVEPQVMDLNFYSTDVVHKEEPIKTVWELMKKSKRSMFPVVNEENRLNGIVSITDIARTYMEFEDETAINNNKTKFSNLLNVLEGEIIYGNYPYEYIEGNIYTDSTLEEDKKLKKGDIVITGNFKKLNKAVIKSGAGCVIVAGGEISDKLYKMGKEVNCAIIKVPHSFFKTIKLINQSIPVSYIMKKHNLIYFQMDDYVYEIKEIMQSSRYRNFPVVDSQGRVKGIISRRHLVDINRKQVILVDHNERGQSIKGLEKADILEIIDHHRVADIYTMSPLYFRAEPLGCTATIISKMYRENNITPTKSMAGLMLSAILSDTLLFKSPTCTEEDKKEAEILAKLAEVDIKTYGMDLITAGTSLEGKTAEEIYYTDMKKFVFGKYNVAISQINTADFKGVFNLIKDIKKIMNKLCEVEKFDLALLMVTDIVLGGTELIVVGKRKELVVEAFGMNSKDESIFLPGVLSRKKQVVPKLMNAAQ